MNAPPPVRSACQYFADLQRHSPSPVSKNQYWAYPHPLMLMSYLKDPMFNLIKKLPPPCIYIYMLLCQKNIEQNA